MKLLSDFARWLLSKVSTLVLIALVLTFVAFGYNWHTQQGISVADMESLRAQVRTHSQEMKDQFRQMRNTERWLDQLKDVEPPAWHLWKWRERAEWKLKYAAASQAHEAARAAHDQATTARAEAERALKVAEGKVSELFSRLRQAFDQTRNQLLVLGAVFLFGPLVWKVFWYYGLAPLAARGAPVQLEPPETGGHCHAVADGKTIEVTVDQQHPLRARMDWVQQYSPELRKDTVFLFDWAAPLVSYASGLRELTRVTAGSPAKRGQVTLTAASDPNAYLVVVELKDHPGLVIRPDHVVALVGDVRLRTRWSLRSLHSWVAGQVRYIIFHGTGTLYIAGHAGVQGVLHEQPVVVEEALVVGHTVNAGFTTVRTETFWPYLRDRTSLFDYRFDHGFVLRQTACGVTARRKQNPFLRAVDTVLGVVGKLLGL
jgi:uncharacterized protein (AIM24 family)